MKHHTLDFVFFALYVSLFTLSKGFGTSGHRSGSKAEILKKIFLDSKSPDVSSVMEIHKGLVNVSKNAQGKLSLSEERTEHQDEEVKLKRKWKESGQSVGDSTDEIRSKSGVGEFTLQGDIVLTRKQHDKIIEEISNRSKGGSRRATRQAFRDHQYPSTIWQNNRVAFFCDQNANQKVRNVFIKAAKEWSENTCIDIYEDTCALSPDKIRVLMQNICWSHVGRIGGEQNLSLGFGCQRIHIAKHEIGHALGLYHTHSRHDRDQFITVDFDNINNDYREEVASLTTDTNYNYDLPFDFGSVMLYGAHELSANKKPVFVPKDMLHAETLGSPFISFYDLLIINMHYNCTEKCPKNLSKQCENGGFPHPRDCGKCICPSGYGGTLCDQRPSGCGKVLKAERRVQTLIDNIGSKGSTPMEDYSMCYYWIQAPFGKKIEVKLLRLSRRDIAIDGCLYGGVEIKTHDDQRLTGYRFCSVPYNGRVLASNLSLVPIITYNSVDQLQTLIHYRYVD